MIRFMHEQVPIRQASLIGFYCVLVAESPLVPQAVRGLLLIVALICLPWGYSMDVAERRQRRRTRAEHR